MFSGEKEKCKKMCKIIAYHSSFFLQQLIHGCILSYYCDRDMTEFLFLGIIDLLREKRRRRETFQESADYYYYYFFDG